MYGRISMEGTGKSELRCLRACLGSLTGFLLTMATVSVVRSALAMAQRVSSCEAGAAPSSESATKRPAAG